MGAFNLPVDEKLVTMALEDELGLMVTESKVLL